MVQLDLAGRDEYLNIETAIRHTALLSRFPVLDVSPLRSFFSHHVEETDKLAALSAFTRQLWKNGVEFPEFFHFLKEIRRNLTSLRTRIPPSDTLIDEFELCLLTEWQRLIGQGFHKKLREANSFILHEKRRYYTVFNRMGEPAFIINRQFQFIETNRAFDRFFHIRGKSHIGNSCFSVINDHLACREAIQMMIVNKTSCSGMETVIEVNGEKRNIVVSGTFLGEINHEVSGAMVIIQDISARKEAARALRENEEKYRTLIENMPDVSWRADKFGTLYFISRNVEQICGYKPDELLGSWPRGRFAMIHPDDLEYVRNEFGIFFASHLAADKSSPPAGRGFPSRNSDAAAAAENYDVTYRFHKKDGSWIWLRSRASKIYEQQGKWFADGVFSDVTELKKAEDELERHHFHLSELVDERTAELRRVNQTLKQEINSRRMAEESLLRLTAKLRQSNEELEQFAHVTSHDLKEPLMLISSFSNRLEKKYTTLLDEPGKKYLRRIVTAAGQMQDLIKALLELSRVGASKRPFELFDLEEVIKEVVESLEESLAECRGRVKCDFKAELLGDKTQIRQLFQNIIVNAIKYRRKDKSLLIIIRGQRLDNGFYQIIVEDNGIGFDQRYARKIFKPLTRLHGRREYDGTGIGLATCRKIVLRHGGEISARGVPGKGSAFIIRLPLSADS
ncbi:PAS domain-containing sensor histidine kinase [Desulfobacterota bacterium M19]